MQTPLFASNAASTVTSGAADIQAGPIVPALVAATVALAVAVFTQFVLSRRESTKLLTQKLEELYLLTLEWEKDCEDLRTQLEWFSQKGAMSMDDLRALVEKQAALKSADKIQMYIALYFPPLQQSARRVWEAHRAFEVLLLNLKRSRQLNFLEVQSAAMRIPPVLARMRIEIPSNRELLTRARLIAPRYRKVEFGRADTDA